MKEVKFVSGSMIMLDDDGDDGLGLFLRGSAMMVDGGSWWTVSHGADVSSCDDSDLVTFG